MVYSLIYGHLRKLLTFFVLLAFSSIAPCFFRYCPYRTPYPSQHNFPSPSYRFEKPVKNLLDKSRIINAEANSFINIISPAGISLSLYSIPPLNRCFSLHSPFESTSEARALRLCNSSQFGDFTNILIGAIYIFNQNFNIKS